MVAYRLGNFWVILLGGGVTLIFLRLRGGRARIFPRIDDKPRAGTDATAGRPAESTADRPH